MNIVVFFENKNEANDNKTDNNKIKICNWMFKVHSDTLNYGLFCECCGTLHFKPNSTYISMDLTSG